MANAQELGQIPRYGMDGGHGHRIVHVGRANGSDYGDRHGWLGACVVFLMLDICARGGALPIAAAHHGGMQQTWRVCLRADGHADTLLARLPRQIVHQAHQHHLFLQSIEERCKAGSIDMLMCQACGT